MQLSRAGLGHEGSRVETLTEEREISSCSLETSFEKRFHCDVIRWHIECIFIVDRLISRSLRDWLSQLGYAGWLWLATRQWEGSVPDGTQSWYWWWVPYRWSGGRGAGFPMNGAHGGLPLLTSSDFPPLSKCTDLLFKYKGQSFLFWILRCNRS